ncbi:unnamed protein product [Dicrocoelium dendriticum]|nr:unnamed protein product [Dicrocoelium dendriticum]
MPRFGILGGGMVGLSTAVALQETYRNAELLIYSPEDISKLVSHGAAGGFRADPEMMPGAVCCSTVECCPECPFVRWCNHSKSHFWQIAASPNSDAAGVFFQPMIKVLADRPPRTPFEASFCGQEKIVDEDELHMLGFSTNVNLGYFYVTCMIEGRYHMPYLRSKLNQQSSTASSRIFDGLAPMSSLQQVYKWAIRENMDVVLNCTGLGAGTLCGDRNILPIRGHLVRVVAPWMKFGIYGPNTTHAFVGKESVILGGFRTPLPCPIDQPLSPKDVEISKEATKDILHRIGTLWHGGLNKAPILEEWTGLRPFRNVVRLELDWLHDDCSSRRVPIIHNYGHGSMGITLSWGTALDAVSLVEQALKSSGTRNRETIVPPGLQKLSLD